MVRANDLLKTYREKRDFTQSPEPRGGVRAIRRGARYVLQKHEARALHFDLRLELDGVLKSWAVPRGPSLNPADRRLAIRTEDHPLEYASFEGVIPAGYGAGVMTLWDVGEWRPEGVPQASLKKGVLKFTLEGERLRGGFRLVKIKAEKCSKDQSWLLIKEDDEYADRNVAFERKWRTGLSAKTPPRKRGASVKADNASPTLFPRFVPPQLAVLADAPPLGDDWLHEIKLDGYRIEALIGGGDVKLMTRSGKDWTQRYGSIVRALRRTKAESAVLDGEVVALDDEGRSDFGVLQRVGNEGDEDQLAFYAFDLLHHNGRSLLDLPLVRRKSMLASLVAGIGAPIRYTEHVTGDGGSVLDAACRLGLEGVISKRADAPYRSGRGAGWLKSKCIGDDEFIVVGYRRSRRRRPFASLLLAEYDGDALVYRGRVGAGFDEETLNQISSRLDSLSAAKSPLTDAPPEARNDTIWVRPELVVQVAYSEKTAAGRLRHPRFKGLREDKPPKEVTMQTADTMTELSGVRLTHPDKVLFPEQGTTKRALATYYDGLADRLLPFLADRPLSVVRCPEGRAKSCFFQRHHNKSIPDEIGAVPITEKEGERQPYLVISDKAGLVAAAQIGVLEFHLWGSRIDRVERPERLIFDLDPGPDLPFSMLRSAAIDVREVLAAAGLESFPLLTGGKGIHVIAPVVRRQEWSATTAFCKGLAQSMAQADRKRFTANVRKDQRIRRVFIDWMRNQRGATAVCPYSPRAREGAPVATPVSWSELHSSRTLKVYNIETITKRLSRLKADPWEGYFNVRQSITKNAMSALAG